MKITDVKIRKLISNSSLVKAIVSITIDGEFAVHDIKIIERTEGKPFIAMPSWKDDNNVYHDYAHPINQVARDKVTDAILTAYQQAKEKAL